MAKKERITQLTDEELVKLRKEIRLNSLFISDYENSFGFDPHEVCEFFDGFMSHITELEKENGEDLPWDEFWKKYDTVENLLAWRDCVACGEGE